MRLTREDTEVMSEDSVEYKSAVKSVIRCQIQSLLQKLAIETGEESIVISTNLSAGTYTHLGSYLGQEWLEDGDEYVQTLCSRFSDFCAGLQNHSQIFTSTREPLENNIQVASHTGHTALPAPRQTPRKRPLTPNNKYSPPNKRKATHYSFESSRLVQLSNETFDVNALQSGIILSTSLQPGSNSSQLSGDHSRNLLENRTSHGSKERPEGQLPVSWIKSEPTDDYSESNGGHDDRNSDSLSTISQTSPQQSIINRPRSLIPLANISKRYGSSIKPVKPEIQEEDSPVATDGLPSQSSILRSLYEQPLYGLTDSCSGVGNERVDSPGQVSLSLPDSLQENIDFPPSSENLVLAGYYDSDNYPKYRHSRKHPAKKSKPVKEKSSANLSLIDTPSTGSKEEPRMRTFESGGRLVYACDVCKRELSHLTSYRRHMKLHTLERPHKCPVCSKGFIRKYHCIDHLNKHHKDVEYDVETLTLTGQSRGLYTTSPVPSGDHQALSDSYSISPSEYNYTLDQSIEGMSDADQSINVSIDQTASTMLSELAKSAARQNNQQEEYKNSQDVPVFKQNVCSFVQQTVEQKLLPENTHEFEVSSQENGKPVEDGSDNQSTGSSSEMKEEKNSSLELKEEKNSSPEMKEEKNSSPEMKEEKNSSPEKKEEKNSSPEKKEEKVIKIADDISFPVQNVENSSMARKQEVSAGIKAIVAHLKSSSRKKKMMTDNDDDDDGSRDGKEKQVLEEAN